MPLFFAPSLVFPPYPWPPLDLYLSCCRIDSTGQLGECAHVQVCVDLCADHACLSAAKTCSGRPFSELLVSQKNVKKQVQEAFPGLLCTRSTSPRPTLPYGPHFLTEVGHAGELCPWLGRAPPQHIREFFWRERITSLGLVSLYRYGSLEGFQI